MTPKISMLPIFLVLLSGIPEWNFVKNSCPNSCPHVWGSKAAWDFIPNFLGSYSTPSQLLICSLCAREMAIYGTSQWTLQIMNLEVEEKKHGVSKKPYLFHEDCLVDLINGLVTLNKKNCLISPCLGAMSIYKWKNMGISDKHVYTYQCAYVNQMNSYNYILVRKKSQTTTWDGPKTL